MMRNRFDEDRDTGLPETPPTVSQRCPAHGCMNAASVSFQGGKFACYAHAKADVGEWQGITRQIRLGWPATANWGEQKAAHEAEQAAKRRAALRLAKPAMVNGAGSIGALVGEATP